MKRCCWVFCAGFLLAGCSTTHVAPVVDMTSANVAAVKRNVQAVPGKIRDWRPATHEVQKGDTLYSIALEYGLDYRDLVSWNNLTDANRILIGQSVRLTAPDSGSATESNKVQAVALKSPSIVTKSLVESTRIVAPLAIKLPYSASALTQLSSITNKSAEQPVVLKSADLIAPVSVNPAPEPVVTAEKVVPAVVSEAPAKDAGDAALDWSWPTNGRVIAEFSEAKASKGIDISGSRGQPVLAAAAGKVVYSGSGLRGYGKLVIIKHSAMYLSAYAHNQQVLVKEGQTISRGQKIAEMGDSDAEQVELHFEIRQMGKPVDPLKYLPEVAK